MGAAQQKVVSLGHRTTLLVRHELAMSRSEDRVFIAGLIGEVIGDEAQVCPGAAPRLGIELHPAQECGCVPR